MEELNNLKLLKENIGVNFHELELSKGFIAMIQKEKKKKKKAEEKNR